MCVAQCLLRASLPHPHNDLEYSSYMLNTALIPGVNVFWSESDQTLIGSTVASLGFVCHWLYTSGHHLLVLKQHNHILRLSHPITYHMFFSRLSLFRLINLSAQTGQNLIITASFSHRFLLIKPTIFQYLCDLK